MYKAGAIPESSVVAVAVAVATKQVQVGLREILVRDVLRMLIN